LPYRYRLTWVVVTAMPAELVVVTTVPVAELPLPEIVVVATTVEPSELVPVRTTTPPPVELLAPAAPEVMV